MYLKSSRRLDNEKEIVGGTMEEGEEVDLITMVGIWDFDLRTLIVHDHLPEVVDIAAMIHTFTIDLMMTDMIGIVATDRMTITTMMIEGLVVLGRQTGGTLTIFGTKMIIAGDGGVVVIPDQGEAEATIAMDDVDAHPVGTVVDGVIGLDPPMVSLVIAKDGVTLIPNTKRGPRQRKRRSAKRAGSIQGAVDAQKKARRTTKRLRNSEIDRLRRLEKVGENRRERIVSATTRIGGDVIAGIGIATIGLEVAAGVESDVIPVVIIAEERMTSSMYMIVIEEVTTMSVRRTGWGIITTIGIGALAEVPGLSMAQILLLVIAGVDDIRIAVAGEKVAKRDAEMAVEVGRPVHIEVALLRHRRKRNEAGAVVAVETRMEKGRPHVMGMMQAAVHRIMMPRREGKGRGRDPDRGRPGEIDMEKG